MNASSVLYNRKTNLTGEMLALANKYRKKHTKLWQITASNTFAK